MGCFPAAGASVYSRPSSHCLVLHRRMPCQLARSLVRLHAPGANLGQTNGQLKVRLSQSRTLVSPASRARGKRTGSSKYAFDKVGTPDSSMPACGTTHACSYEAAVLAGGKTQRSRRCLSEVRRRGVHSTRVLTGGGAASTKDHHKHQKDQGIRIRSRPAGPLARDKTREKRNTFPFGKKEENARKTAE